VSRTPVRSLLVWSAIVGAFVGLVAGGPVAGPAAASVGQADLVAGVPAPEGMQITDLGTLPGGDFSYTIAANDEGQVIGVSNAADGGYHGFLWERGVMTDLGNLAAADYDTVLTAINDRGQIIGLDNRAGKAFIWQNGKRQFLGSLGGGGTHPSAINNSGQVVGSSLTATGELHPFMWQDGVMTDLGRPGDDESGVADAINERGEVAGRLSTMAGERVFVWRNGSRTILPTLGGVDAFILGQNVINARGDVAGYSGTTPGELGHYHPFLWRDGTLLDLAPVGSQENIFLTDAISARGDTVVGERGDYGTFRAFVWTNGIMTDLGIPTGVIASSIVNDLGQVATVAWNTDLWQLRSYLWQDGQLTEVPGLAPGGIAVADITNSGLLAGRSTTASGATHATVWTITGVDA
jgi:probable HAF family extracellular repeat protein